MNTNPSIYKLSSEYKFLDIEQNVIVRAIINTSRELTDHIAFANAASHAREERA